METPGRGDDKEQGGLKATINGWGLDSQAKNINM
jgi:hypothetical protein